MCVSAWPSPRQAAMPRSSSTWYSAIPRCTRTSCCWTWTFPTNLAAAFGGPRHGIGGLRRRADAFGRALTCSALKPQGVPPARLAQLAEQFARGGIDFIKDDHGLADQAYSPFAERVAAIAGSVGRTRLCAQPVGRSRRDAPPDRHSAGTGHRHGDDRANACRLVHDAGAGEAISGHGVLRPPDHGRRGAHRPGPADRQAVPRCSAPTQ